MSLAAEVQWSLLPPTTHRADDVVISAALEPAYDTGGDVFDYSRDGPTLRLAVLDAMGHGFQAAVLSVTVTAALRLGRREGADLPELAGRMAAAVGAWAPETSFVTAVLVDLDLRNGDVKWLTAGHIPPLRVGPDGSTPLPHTPGLPLGVVLGDDAPALAVHDGRLEHGESLVLYSDGVVDNLMLAGLSSIDDRESAMRGSVERHIADPPTPGVARRIVAEMLERTGPDLRDDATLMVVHPTATD